MKNIGVSFIICCYNSSERLPNTLQHLASLRVPPEVPWEVLIIDNASTDNTVQIAKMYWSQFGNVAPLHILFEGRPGQSYARMRGLNASKFDYICFVDDDNWLSENWVECVIRIFGEHPEVGACGGQSEAICQVTKPSWFDTFQRSYACGPQAQHDEHVNILYGAGLCIRKEAWINLIQNGFQPVTIGHSGQQLSGGDDIELVWAVYLSGWKLWYSSDLKLQHFIPGFRLDWAYLRRLWRGFGAAQADLDAYSFWINNPKGHINLRNEWWYRALGAIWQIIHIPNYMHYIRYHPQGNQNALMVERLWAYVSRLAQLRSDHDQLYKCIQNASWRK